MGRKRKTSVILGRVFPSFSPYVKVVCLYLVSIFHFIFGPHVKYEVHYLPRMLIWESNGLRLGGVIASRSMSRDSKDQRTLKQLNVSSRMVIQGYNRIAVSSTVARARMILSWLAIYRKAGIPLSLYLIKFISLIVFLGTELAPDISCL